MRKYLDFLLLFGCTVFCSYTKATVLSYDHLPIDDYPQNIEQYLPKTASNYNKALLPYKWQKAQSKQLYRLYYSTDKDGLSPWNEQFVQSIIKTIISDEISDVQKYQNEILGKGKIQHYGLNYHKQNTTVFKKIINKIDLESLARQKYSSTNRAIITHNTYARALPDAAPDFYDISLPGEGFPFDTLQQSALWVGTPVYIISSTIDKAWSLVLTPDAYIAWVKSEDIAKTDTNFINRWNRAAKNQLIAITNTNTSILNEQNQFQFTGFIGSFFPFASQGQNEDIKVLLPIKNNQKAEIIIGIIPRNFAAKIPLVFSPKNISKIISQLLNLPYGWGGIYFYNDCSQEMKSFLTPFGIWLPRNSTAQANYLPSLDLSSYSSFERLQLIKQYAKPFVSLIYLGHGHVMLIVQNSDDGLISYQNVWALASKNNDKRYIIGKALLLPLLEQYQQTPAALPQLKEKRLKLLFLNKKIVKLTNKSYKHLFL